MSYVIQLTHKKVGVQVWILSIQFLFGLNVSVFVTQRHMIPTQFDYASCQRSENTTHFMDSVNIQWIEEVRKKFLNQMRDEGCYFKLVE